MSTFALFTLILLLFVFAAGLGFGSLARMQRDRQIVAQPMPKIDSAEDTGPPASERESE